MSSLEPRNESDLVAVKAGINVKYPGLSEYAENVGTVNPLFLKNNFQITNHSIRNELLQNHKLRLLKFQDKSTLKVTGNSEYRTHFNRKIEPEQYKRVTITRKDIDKSIYFENLPKNIEKSEYATSFGFTQPLAYKKTTVLAINPTQDVLSATGGRPLIKKIDYDPKTAISQTKNDHQWPKLEKRELFEWIK